MGPLEQQDFELRMKLSTFSLGLIYLWSATEVLASIEKDGSQFGEEAEHITFVASSLGYSSAGSNTLSQDWPTSTSIRLTGRPGWNPAWGIGPVIPPSGFILSLKVTPHAVAAPWPQATPGEYLSSQRENCIGIEDPDPEASAFQQPKA
ncbi:hypothetical protein CVT26_005023 [Gymnopilus dilepis]|uniref:Uncharacterized protein n=1 Tax=Gymnopilus dilepis TaxID=231916 RepID=A0A409XZX9_9AGAR|nr:hypothetical protein CVT26_005023 [Gymnopilus dilepis]